MKDLKNCWRGRGFGRGNTSFLIVFFVTRSVEREMFQTLGISECVSALIYELKRVISGIVVQRRSNIQKEILQSIQPRSSSMTPPNLSLFLAKLFYKPGSGTTRTQNRTKSNPRHQPGTAPCQRGTGRGSCRWTTGPPSRRIGAT